MSSLQRASLPVLRRWRRSPARVIVIALIGGYAAFSIGENTEPAPASLHPASSFATIEDDAMRAAALFNEAGKVLTHPRCVNCHPAGDQPHQGDTPTLHQPDVRRGRDGFGAVGMRCDTCHHAANFDPGRVPGTPHWHLAPRQMAWEGLSVHEICTQLKDPTRNGGRSLEAIVEHMRQDPLVAWGWDPGVHREPAPGDQTTFGDLIAAWVEAGAACPPG